MKGWGLKKMTATPKKKSKRYYWWRLRKNFFTQITINKLRRSENGDTKAIIYLQMVLMTIDNDGYIQYEGVEDDISDEIAIALDEDSNIVKETVNQLTDMGLIEIVEDDYFLPEAKSGIDSEAESTERSRKCRARKKEKALHCNVDATDSNANEIGSNIQATQSREDKIRENKSRINKSRINKEIERKKEIYPSQVSSSESKLLEPEKIVSLFNDICKSYEPIRNYMVYSSALSTCICFGYTEHDYRQAFTNAENSDYLKGLTENKTYQSKFDWILEHLEEVKNGKYN